MAEPEKFDLTTFPYPTGEFETPLGKVPFIWLSSFRARLGAGGSKSNLIYEGYLPIWFAADVYLDFGVWRFATWQQNQKDEDGPWINQGINERGMTRAVMSVRHYVCSYILKAWTEFAEFHTVEPLAADRAHYANKIMELDAKHLEATITFAAERASLIEALRKV